MPQIVVGGISGTMDQQAIESKLVADQSARRKLKRITDPVGNKEYADGKKG